MATSAGSVGVVAGNIRILADPSHSLATGICTHKHSATHVTERKTKGKKGKTHNDDDEEEGNQNLVFPPPSSTPNQMSAACVEVKLVLPDTPEHADN